MSLIEHLGGAQGCEWLKRTIETTVSLLERDPFGYAGSSVDDLKGSLIKGGIARARSVVLDQARRAVFSDAEIARLANTFDQTVHTHRGRFLAFDSKGT